MAGGIEVVDEALEFGAVHEVLGRAGQRVLDEGLGLLGPGDAAVELGVVTVEHAAPGGRVVSGEHDAQLVEAETDLPRVDVPNLTGRYT